MTNIFQKGYNFKKKKTLLIIFYIMICLSLSIIIYKLSYNYAAVKIRNNWENKDYKK